MNFFEKQSIISVERVILAEDIELPKIAKKKDPLTHKYLKNNDEYKLKEREYTNIVGKFFLTIMTPLVSKGLPNTTSCPAPSKFGHRGQNLNVKSYKSSNYIELTIPKYIIYNFRKLIPKGTEFIVASVGGSTDPNDMRIIGLWTIVEEEDDSND